MALPPHKPQETQQTEKTLKTTKPQQSVPVKQARKATNVNVQSQKPKPDEPIQTYYPHLPPQLETNSPKK